MTNRITDDTIRGASETGGTFVVSVANFVLHCLNDEHRENQDFMTGYGCDLANAIDLLYLQVKNEADELSILDHFARMARPRPDAVIFTPQFKKVYENCKDAASKEQRDMYFEDFLNELYKQDKIDGKNSQVVYILDSCGFKYEAPDSSTKSKKSKFKYRELYKLCEDLNEKASQKKIDPLIGRTKEVQRMIEILAHYKKKNPLLVGPPGVGKTQVVLGLASKIEQGLVPDALKNARIFSLEVSTVLGGTKFRGDFEQKMNSLLKDIKKMAEDGEVQPILFIDEIHQIMGAGSTGQGQGFTDMANILKPMLANGELSLIGSTTDDEYKQKVSKDKALTRRLQQVKIEEPSEVETLRILEQGIKPVLQKYHGVKYPKHVLERAVELSGKYITQQYFPDKAISLIDSVGAKLRTDDASARVVANIGDVETIVSEITGTPVSAFKKNNNKNAYIDLDAVIKKDLYGQDDAVEKIVECYELSKAGLSDESQPIGSWLLLGPTGVGKTELAKLIAQKTESHFFKINMGEYGEKHSPAKLFGAPPGYEGHRDGGVLTNEITKYPHTVLLLDEIEKAHTKVYEALLGIIDGGSMTDGEGNTVDFKNVLILMTSNAGAAASLRTKRPVGLGSTNADEAKAKNTVKMDVINDTFSPEFRNKLSGIVHFNALDKKVISKITDKFVLKTINKMFLKKNINLIVPQEVKDYISEEGYDPDFGARPIVRTVLELIDKPLVKPILKGKIKSGDTVTYKMVDGKPEFDITKPQPTKEEKQEVTQTESK